MLEFLIIIGFLEWRDM